MGRLALRLKREADHSLAETAVLAVPGVIGVVLKNEKVFLIEHEDDGKDYVFELKATNFFCLVSPEVTMHNSINVQLSGMDDLEIDSMSPEDLKNKLKSIRDMALWWACQEEDDRCWLDDVKVLKSILPHGSVNFSMPDDLTFIGECLRYKKTRCPVDPKIHEW